MGLAFGVRPAHAQRAEDVQAAAAAFAEGQRAQLRGDHARAAELFEVADRAAPSPQALRSAIRNHRRADEPARAATLAARALTRYPDDEETTALARDVLEATRGDLGHLVVRCAPACSVALGGRAASAEPRTRLELYLVPGEPELVASWPDRPELRRTLRVEAGSDQELALEPPAPEAEEPGGEPALAVEEPGPAPVDAAGAGPVDPATGDGAEAGGGGVHPAFFAVGVGLTAVGAGLAVWSGVDTLDARDAYEANPTREGYEDGLAREWRTNGFLIGTAAVGIATVVLAIFTDWGGEDEAPVTAAAGPDGGLVMLRGEVP